MSIEKVIVIKDAKAKIKKLNEDWASQKKHMERDLKRKLAEEFDILEELFTFLKNYKEDSSNKNYPNNLLVDEDEDIASALIEEIVKTVEKEDSIWDILKSYQNVEKEKPVEDVVDISDMICGICESIGSLKEDAQTSALVCTNCGIVNERLLDQSPEWRNYNDDSKGDNVGRCGGPTSFYFPKSCQGTLIAGRGNSRLMKKQKWNTMVYKERTLNCVFEYITSICVKNGITKSIIIDDAKFYYKNLSECKHMSGPKKGKPIIIRRVNRISIIAACIFKACENNMESRNVKEIAVYVNLPSKKITKGIKEFDNLIKNSPEMCRLFDQYRETDIAEDFINRHCPKLNISPSDIKLAIRISRNCSKMKLVSDHNPQPIATGAILAMIEYKKLDISRKQVSAQLSTSEVTINKICKKINVFIEALVDDDLTDHLIVKFKING